MCSDIPFSKLSLTSFMPQRSGTTSVSTFSSFTCSLVSSNSSVLCAAGSGSPLTLGSSSLCCAGTDFFFGDAQSGSVSFELGDLSLFLPLVMFFLIVKFPGCKKDLGKIHVCKYSYSNTEYITAVITISENCFPLWQIQHEMDVTKESYINAYCCPITFSLCSCSLHPFPESVLQPGSSAHLFCSSTFYCKYLILTFIAFYYNMLLQCLLKIYICFL